MKKKIMLGDQVIDTVTDYEGMCTGIIEYMNGCRRIGIQSKERSAETGLPVDMYWIDETTVKVKEKQVQKTVQKEKGGINARSSRNAVPVFKPF